MDCCWTNAPLRLVQMVELGLLIDSNVAADAAYAETVETLIARAGCLSCHAESYLNKVEAGLWCLIRQLAEPAWDCSAPASECVCGSPDTLYRQNVEALCAMLAIDDPAYSCDFETRLAAVTCLCWSAYQLRLARLVALLDLENNLGGTATIESAGLVGGILNPSGQWETTLAQVYQVMAADGGFELPLCDSGMAFAPLAGAGDTLDCYADGVEIAGLDNGSGFSGPWVDQPLLLAVVSNDSLDSYADDVEIQSLADGFGWPAGWVDVQLSNRVVSNDSLDSYADDVEIQGLADGFGWGGAFEDSNLTV